MKSFTITLVFIASLWIAGYAAEGGAAEGGAKEPLKYDCRFCEKIQDWYVQAYYLGYQDAEDNAELMVEVLENLGCTVI